METSGPHVRHSTSEAQSGSSGRRPCALCTVPRLVMKLTAYEPQGDKDAWAERDAQGVALLCSYMAGDVCESSPCFSLFNLSPLESGARGWNP